MPLKDDEPTNTFVEKSCFRKRVQDHREFWFDSLHITTLCGVALAQPLYDILGNNAAFFAARGSRPVDIILMVFTLSFAIPLFLMVVEKTVGFAGCKYRKMVHAAFIAILIGIFAMLLLKRVIEPHGFAILILSCVIGIAVSIAYVRFHHVRSFFSALSPSIVVFPTLFFLFTPVSKLFYLEILGDYSFDGTNTNISVFLIVLDELPVSSLMDENFSIDADRYPNFAKFADTSYWYRNARSNASTTIYSVPSILTGRYPEMGKMPLSIDYPRNLFTAFAKSHNIFAMEIATGLCPISICESSILTTPWTARYRDLISDLYLIYLHLVLPEMVTEDLPSVNQNWKNFGEKIRKPIETQKTIQNRNKSKNRPGALIGFKNSIHSDVKPSLYFLHIGQPHGPWKFLPSGRVYTSKWKSVSRWDSNENMVFSAYQRHLLQVGHADKLLGITINKIKSEGMFDESLIIITSDHGTSFRKGGHRRMPTVDNYQDIYRVPLFIKIPGQSKGVVLDSKIELVDLLPTITEVAGLDTKWKFHGKSVFDPTKRKYRKHKIHSQKGKPKTIVIEDQLDLLFQSVLRKVDIFGSGNDKKLYHFGPNGYLVGKSIEEFERGMLSSVTAILEQDELLKHVDSDSSFLPAHITGTIHLTADREQLDLAIVKDEIIIGTTSTHKEGGSPLKLDYAVVIPESSLDNGRNDLDIYLIEKSDGPQPILLKILRKSQ